MSDHQNDVLAAIDGALDDWTVSGDAMRWQPPERELPKRPVDRYTMGRASHHNPPSIAVPMRNGAQTADAHAAGSEQAYRESFAGQVEALHERFNDSVRAMAERLGMTVEALQTLGEALANTGTAARAFAFQGATGTLPTFDEAQVMLCNVADPASPTLAELDAGIPIATVGPGGFVEVSLTVFPRTDPRPEPATPEEFRRRALEHQQNRGTGPKPGRRIPPRDLRR